MVYGLNSLPCHGNKLHASVPLYHVEEMKECRVQAVNDFECLLPSEVRGQTETTRMLQRSICQPDKNPLDFRELIPITIKQLSFYLSLEVQHSRLEKGEIQDERLTLKSLTEKCQKMLDDLRAKSLQGYDGYGRSLRFRMLTEHDEEYELLVPGVFTRSEVIDVEIQKLDSERIASDLIRVTNRHIASIVLKKCWSNLLLNDETYKKASEAYNLARKKSTDFNRDVYTPARRSTPSSLDARRNLDKVTKEYNELQKSVPLCKKELVRIERDVKERWIDSIFSGYDVDRVVDGYFIQSRLREMGSLRLHLWANGYERCKTEKLNLQNHLRSAEEGGRDIQAG